MRRMVNLIFILSLFAIAGYQGFYYKTMEALGHPKRDLLVDRVEDARDAQQDTKEQFQSARVCYHANLLYRLVLSGNSNQSEENQKNQHQNSSPEYTHPLCLDFNKMPDKSPKGYHKKYP